MCECLSLLGFKKLAPKKLVYDENKSFEVSFLFFQSSIDQSFHQSNTLVRRMICRQVPDLTPIILVTPWFFSSGATSRKKKLYTSYHISYSSHDKPFLFWKHTSHMSIGTFLWSLHPCLLNYELGNQVLWISTRLFMLSLYCSKAMNVWISTNIKENAVIKTCQWLVATWYYDIYNYYIRMNSYEFFSDSEFKMGLVHCQLLYTVYWQLCRNNCYWFNNTVWKDVHTDRRLTCTQCSYK